jgi:hypothetical protein
MFFCCELCLSDLWHSADIFGTDPNMVNWLMIDGESEGLFTFNGLFKFKILTDFWNLNSVWKFIKNSNIFWPLKIQKSQKKGQMIQSAVNKTPKI